jgi:hypothetical protein
MNSPNYQTSIQGVSSTISALQSFAPDLKKALDKEIKGFLEKLSMKHAVIYLLTFILQDGLVRIRTQGLLAHCNKVKAEAVLFALMLQKLRQESKVCRRVFQRRLQDSKVLME